jgi:hypothetical protein
MNRRQFIKSTAQCFGMILTSQLLGPRLVCAQTGSNNKNIIMWMKDGGEDSHYTHPPVGSIGQLLQPLRPDITVPSGSILNILNNSIGLNPLYAPINPIVSNGNYKVV